MADTPQSRSQEMAQRLAALEAEIRGRTPRAEARVEVKVTNPPIRTVYQTQMRIAGPRDAVLDYCAFVWKDAGPTQPGQHSPVSLEAIEKDEGGQLTVLVAKDLYQG